MSDDLLDRARKYADTKCQSPNGSGGQMTNPDGTTVSFAGASWPCGMCHSCRSINERHLLDALVARCERAEADAVHWKANHDKQVDSKRHTHDLLVQSRQHVASLLRSHEAADEEIDRLRQRLKQALR